MLPARRQGHLLLDTRQSVTGPGLYVFSSTKRQIQQKLIRGLLGEL